MQNFHGIVLYEHKHIGRSANSRAKLKATLVRDSVLLFISFC